MDIVVINPASCVTCAQLAAIVSKANAVGSIMSIGLGSKCPTDFIQESKVELISSVLVFDIFAMDGYWPKDLNEVLILIELASADACKWE